ncbi:hypothetical protein H7I41_28265 [Mycobacterium manitobense]|uniref:DUF732 domain-containing protein n=1 Tax=[Mycobacterium] manitobense TaxID=190147 RepID=A0A9X2YT17_9MYCO|nr:hypothetical protein [[Mycobacterium] manitobense]MCV7173825.1 hypothetical protein [[Mycobacterium] manitobense]
MRIKRIHLVTVSSAILVAAGGFAAPVATAQEPPEMPDVVDMRLDEAQEEVITASGNPDLVLNTQNIKSADQQQLVEKFWKVCWQSPEAGEPMSEDAWYGVGITRAGEECYS